MYPEDEDHYRNSSNNSFCYTPNETPPNEDVQISRNLLDRSPQNPSSTPPNVNRTEPELEKHDNPIDLYHINDKDGLPVFPSEDGYLNSETDVEMGSKTAHNTEEVDFWALADIDTDYGSNWSDLDCKQKMKRVIVDWCLKPLLVLALLFFFVCSLDLMSSAFRLIGGREAGQVLAGNDLLNNPICGLMMGILVTVLVQSSSTSTSIVVSIVSAGLLQVEQAIFIVMGANIGTSVTNTIVALSQAGDRNEFRRAFGAATVHDMFNWLAVLVLLPVEVCTGYLFRITHLIVNSFAIESNENAKFDILKKLTKPFTSLIIQLDKKVISKIAVGEVDKSELSLLKTWCKKGHLMVETNDSLWDAENKTGLVTRPPVVTEIIEVGIEKCHYLLADTGLPEGAVGAILLGVSLVMLCVCLILMVKILHSLMKGRMAGIIRRTINADFPGIFSALTGYFAILVGAVVTFVVQSSSVFTSTITPLVGMGVITLERVYPLTLGANIGTTATGMLAALASSGDSFEKGIQIALCHFFFNISGILLWYPVPCLRKVPLYLAKNLGNTTAKYRWFAIMYLIVLFFLLPSLVFGLSIISIWCLVAVGGPLFIIFALVIIVNILQRKKSHWLPQKLRTWHFLPLWMRSLEPVDAVITKFGPKHCCCHKKGKQQITSRDCAVQYEPPVMVAPVYTAVHIIPGKESCV